MCNAMDRQTAAVSEEFYDNLVTCDIKSVDYLITALVVEPNIIQRLKGNLSNINLITDKNMVANCPCDQRVTGTKS